MTIHAGLFASGVLLLLFPADRLLSRLVQLRSFDRFQSLENSPRYRPWWWVPLLWIDPVRGYVGVLSLKASVATGSIDWATTPKVPYAMVVAILCLSVSCQMFTRRGDEVVLAPIGFVAGMVAALTPWTVALIGVTMGLTAMFAFRRFHPFFSVGLAAVGILGLVVRADPIWLIPALAALAVPVVLGAVSGRALEIPTRDDSAPVHAVRSKP